MPPDCTLFQPEFRSAEEIVIRKGFDGIDALFELADIREFVKGLYAMLNEGEEYEMTPGFLGGAEYGRSNT